MKREYLNFFSSKKLLDLQKIKNHVECQQNKVDKKNSLPRVQLKNGTFFYMDTRK
jgi:hypothetical protein